MREIKVYNLLDFIMNKKDKVKLELIGKTTYPDKDRLLVYLLEAGKYTTLPSKRICEICGKDAGSTNYYTDGYWIWPEWISHYLNDHHIKLPDKFIGNIRKKQYKIDNELVNGILNDTIELQFHV